MLKFPEDLADHFIVLMFKEYVYTGGGVHSEFTGGGDIILPLPKSLQDSLNVKVGADELGIMGSAVAEGSAAMAGQSFSDVAGKLKSMMSTGVDQATGAAQTDSLAEGFSMVADTTAFLTTAGLGAIAPDMGKGLGAGTGTAINPYATLVFSGVDLKTHTFEWTLSPNSADESKTLEDIIRLIQRNIVPEVSGVAVTGGSTTLARGLLRYPSMVEVRFEGVDFYKIKTSMISAFAVDYAPEGIAIHRQGKPAVVRITMTMTEAAIHTKDDYKEPLAPGGAGAGQGLSEIVVTAQRLGFDSTGEPLVSINTTVDPSFNSGNTA